MPPSPFTLGSPTALTVYPLPSAASRASGTGQGCVHAPEITSGVMLEKKASLGNANEKSLN